MKEATRAKRSERPSAIFSGSDMDRSPTETRWRAFRYLHLVFFLLYPATTGATPSPDEHLAQRLATIEAHARALFERVDRMAPWPVFFPSVATHRLLACGRSCSSPDTTTSFVAAWFDGTMAEGDLRRLHRGELLARAADLGLSLETTISFTSGTSTTVGSLLQEARSTIGAPPPAPWNAREAKKGPEYGWLLQAFCTYLGPTAPLNDTWTLEDLITRITTQGVNTRTEAGTHELEGLATCLHLHTASAPAGPSPAYAALAETLSARLQDDLDRMTVEGQFYAEATNFSRCPGNSSRCDLLTAIIKQAHFFEWAPLVPGFSVDGRVQQALARLDALLEQAQLQIDEAWIDQHGVRAALVLAATSHTLHALGRLRTTQYIRHSTPSLPDSSDSP